MSVKLFLPQTTLEEWAIDEQADLISDELTLLPSKSVFRVVPAVHFQRVVSGEDAQFLVGRVKTVTQLETIGAEHLAGSVILGETAYDVVEGYVTEAASPAATQTGAAAQGRPPISAPRAPDPITVPMPVPAGDQHPAAVVANEADLLAAFILDKL
jgi:hypothetical protein